MSADPLGDLRAKAAQLRNQANMLDHTAGLLRMLDCPEDHPRLMLERDIAAGMRAAADVLDQAINLFVLAHATLGAPVPPPRAPLKVLS